MHKRTISIVDAADFKNTYSTGITYMSGSTPTSGKWCYNDTGKFVEVNTTRGYFRPFIGKLALGDKVKITVELMNVSGINIVIDPGFSDTNFLNASSIYSAGTRRTSSEARWETYEYQYVAKYACEYASVMIGLQTGETGVYRIKKIIIDVESAYPDKKIRKATIQKASGLYAQVTNYSDDTATLTLVDTNILKVQFKAFAGTISAPKAVAKVSTQTYPYAIICSDAAVGSSYDLVEAQIRFYDFASGAAVALASVSDGVIFDVLMFG